MLTDQVQTAIRGLTQNGILADRVGRLYHPQRPVTDCDPPSGKPRHHGGTLVAFIPPPGWPDWTRSNVRLPQHRTIVAVDIEQSTNRPDSVKGLLRRTLYDLFDRALHSAGIHKRHRDRFADRGDGFLALIRPVDQASKPVLLNRVIPVFRRLLAEYNASVPRADRLHLQLRVRIVVHAGEIYYDANGCFGEALDIAFRFLNAPGVKKALRTATDPLTLVISGEIYQTIVRHGCDGIDPDAFQPLIRVHVAGHHYPGWIHTKFKGAQLHLADLTSYKRSALYSGGCGSQKAHIMGPPGSTARPPVQIPGTEGLPEFNIPLPAAAT